MGIREEKLSISISRLPVLLAVIVASTVIGVVLVGKLSGIKLAPQRTEVSLSSSDLWDISRYRARQNYTTRARDINIGGGFQRIPFVSFYERRDAQPSGQLLINDKYKSRFISSEGIVFDFPFSGVPIDLKIIDGKYNFAFRKIFNGRLFRLIYDPSGQLIGQQPVELENVDFPIFRAAAVIDGGIYWVIYDNNKRKNYLIYPDFFKGASDMMLELPTFYPPAGGTYEMEPPVFFAGDGHGSIRLIAGAQLVRIMDGKMQSQRLSECETAIEALFIPDGETVLCRAISGKSASYLINHVRENRIEYLDATDGIPWLLSYAKDKGVVSVRRAKSQGDILEMFRWDLRNSQQSGLLEFGINNIEGRIPWSQIYYINGLMDLLLLIDIHDGAKDIFLSMVPDLLQRVAIEIRSLDDLLDQPMGFHSKGFTHDRSMALFAVQTSRLLLLFDRYLEDFPYAPPLKNIHKLAHSVANLEGHIEVLAREGENVAWMKQGTAHLRWPKCSSFYFDGMPVPYNHQNEWAYSLFNGARVRGFSPNSQSLDDQRQIISFFLEKLGKNGGFPDVSGWYYWYGHAFDGWGQVDNLSCNMPKYSGDRGLAWISFRTIDLMSVLSALDFMTVTDRESLLDSAFNTVKEGGVYPFASRSLIALGKIPQVRMSVLERYFRATSPWELSNTPWALAMSVKTLESFPLKN